MENSTVKRGEIQNIDLGYGPVMGTLLRMSLPAIGMMLLNTLISLVDTIFVSWLGERVVADIRTRVQAHLLGLPCGLLVPDLGIAEASGLQLANEAIRVMVGLSPARPSPPVVRHVFSQVGSTGPSGVMTLMNQCQ